MFSVGVVGSMEIKDIPRAEELLDEGIKKVLCHAGVETKNCEVVSGLYYKGIIALAYDWAEKHRLKTVGVICKKDCDFEPYDCAEIIVEGENWGDESQVFVDRVDALVKIGGGNQSKNEVELFKQKKDFDSDLLFESEI